jgi:hypothetical protein
MRMKFRLNRRRWKAPKNLLLGGGGIQFRFADYPRHSTFKDLAHSKFQTFDEDDELDPDSQSVPTDTMTFDSISLTASQPIRFHPTKILQPPGWSIRRILYDVFSRNSFQRQKFRENEANVSSLRRNGCDRCPHIWLIWTTFFFVPQSFLYFGHWLLPRVFLSNKKT